MAKGSRREKRATAPNAPATALFGRAEAAHLAGDLDSAAALYRQVLRQVPEDAPSQHRLGMIAAQRGAYAEAVAHFDAALARAPDFVEALRHRAAARRLLGDPDGALRDMTRMLELDPGDAPALCRYAEYLATAGRLVDAVDAYSRALALAPGHAEGHARRADLLAELGRAEDALAGYAGALAARPDWPACLTNRAAVLADLGRNDEAIDDLEHVLRLTPEDAVAWYNRGILLKRLGHADAAARSLEQALPRQPSHIAACLELGLLRLDAGQAEAALACFDQAIAARADCAEAHNDRGLALAALARDEEALAAYQRAIETRPELAQAYFNRGNALHRAGRLEAALADFSRVIELCPEYPGCYNWLGIVHADLGQYAAALADYRRAEEQTPENPVVHNNAGNVLRELERYAEALASIERALILRPDYVEAYNNRGLTQHAMGEREAALASYARAIELDAEYAKAYWNSALCLLQMGRFRDGWRRYEWRWRLPEYRRYMIDSALPGWLGEVSPAGKTLLLHAEQGYGDTLQFCRFAEPLRRLGARVLLQMPPDLMPLLRGLTGIDGMYAKGEALPEHDLHCPLMSLPLALGIDLDNLPAEPGYLSADPARVAEWDKRLGAGDALRVGLAWSGNAKHKNDRRRSLALAEFAARLPCLDGLEYHSLQKEIRAGDIDALAAHAGIRHWGGHIEDFADTAALCMLMDVVVCVDTSVAHLAGALGRPTWLLLDHNPDWRWLLERGDSPWYPSMRLYRQSRPGDWHSVFAPLAADLSALADARPRRRPASAVPEAAVAPRAPVGDPLRAAVDAHRAGRLDEAEAAYRQALARQPDCFDAAHLLGVVLAQSGRAEAGLAFLDRAVALDPRSAAALNNRGGAYAVLGRDAEAMADFRHALELKADFAEAHSGLGGALLRQGQPEAALASLERASALAPDSVASHFERAQALRALGRQEDAVAAYARALALNPGDPQAFYYRGNCLLALGRAEAALADFDAALALRPEMAEAHNNRGNALLALGRVADALAALRRAIELRPEFAEARYNLGVALREAGEAAAALAAYDRAIELQADFADAHYNRGIVLKDLRRHAEALASYDRAIALRPDFVEAHWNAGLCALQSGDFARGWAEHEWRWRRPAGIPLRRDFAAPLWLGEVPVAGKTVLLHSEHGYGDTLQFCRYAARVAELGGRVVLEVEQSLLEVMASLAGVHARVAKGKPLPDFDLHCPLMSLPLAFKTDLASIPAAPRYLAAPPAKVAEWAARLGPRLKPRLGIAWSGNPQHGNDQNRSLGFADLAGALPADLDMEIHSLQKVVRDADLAAFQARPEIRDWRAELNDFADTAALCEAMDLIVSVDTSVAHLAGALGRPVWILLPSNPDWRWLLEREDSPWYPSARLLRQAKAGDWAPVLERLEASLRDRFGAASPSGVPGTTTTPVAATPDVNAEQYLRRAYARKQAGELDAALADFDRALALRVDDPRVLNGRALLFHALGRLREARADLEQAVALDPGYTDALGNLGSILAGLGEHEAAVATLQRALAGNPEHVGARVNLGIALAGCGRPEAALAEFDKAVRIEPGHAIAHLNRGNALEALNQPEAALAAYARAIDSRPEWAEAHNNLGNILRKLARHVEALDSYDRAISIDPSKYIYHGNRGIVLNDLERRAEALLAFTRAHELAPDDADIHWNRAVCLLQTGDFAHGWAEYEWRWQCAAHADAMRHLSQARLRSPGEITGKTVLLHSEQGLGDTLQFCRYAALVAASGGRVVLEVPRLLRRLLAGLSGPEWVLARGEPLPAFDLHSPLMSLPYVFNTDLASIPAAPRYLAAPPAKVAEWTARLGPRRKPRLGIVWSGNPGHDNDRNRSLPFAEMVAALPSDLGIEIHSLQKDVRDADLAAFQARPEIRDWRAELNDFADTAALCEAMDLIVCVDTSVAHLAGALGRPVWILLPSNPDWRWLLEREDSPWYPSARLLRQAMAGDWASLLQGLGARLRAWRATQAPGDDSSPASQAGLLVWRGERAARGGDLGTAEMLYRQADALCPESALAALRLGDLAARAGQHDVARPWFEAAVRRAPGDAEACFRLAQTLADLGEDGAAVAAYDQALAARPNLVAALNNRAVLLTRLERHAEALDDYRRALELDPGFVEAHCNQGNLLRALARRDEACAALERAIALAPDNAEAHNSLGLARAELGQDVDALLAYARALELKPEYPDARLNYANALANLGRHEDALATLDRVLDADPEQAMAHVNRALCRLQWGCFASGWREYEWRWRLVDAGIAPRRFEVPLWLGETAPAGRRILLHSEQGLGDTLQFCRYVARVAALGARVVLEVEAPLRALLTELSGVETLLVKGEPPPPYDLHCPLLSLPLAFATDFDSLPAAVPYLAVPADKMTTWTARLGASATPRVGLVWSGGRAHKNDHRRSLALAEFLAAIPEDLAIERIVLQKEIRQEDGDCLAAHPELRHFGALIDDFADSAALCQAMDLIVCVDTSVAHLAGALGKPVWLLLPYNPDWRWLLERDDSPWYPSMRLFRQDAPGDWRAVLRRVASALRARYPGAADADPERQRDRLVEAALARHRQGDLAGAEALYRRILEDDPEDFDALHLLGVVEAVSGRREAALARIGAALARRPDASAYHNRAQALWRLGRHAEAALDYRRALAMRPAYREAWSGLANVLRAAGDAAAALAALDAGLTACPGDADLHLGHAQARKALGQAEAALADFDRALAARPDMPVALNGRGVLRLAQGRHVEAEADLRRAADLDPDNVDILANLGSALTGLGRADAALACLERAVALDPGHVGARVNLGLAHAARDDAAAALVCHERAVALDPGRVEAHIGLGVSLADQGRHAEARAAFRRAVELCPEEAEAHWNLALASLLMGDYAEGWREYAWRWRRAANPPPAWLGDRPAWLGEADIAGRTLLLHSEQGYGDTLQFCRYAGLAAARGARVVLYVEPALARLCATLAGVAEVVGKDRPAPHFDRHCAVLGLPLACAEHLMVADAAYLSPPEDSAASWRARLGPPRAPRVGLIWRGNPGHRNDRRRSIPLARFLAGLPDDLGIVYHCLHKEAHADDVPALAARPDIRVWHDAIGDFADLAGLCAQLDLVIAVDTAGAHLAGALAKPAWILLPFNPDWRWLLARDDSPWYASARLFRQDAPGAWDDVLGRVAESLRAFVATLADWRAAQATPAAVGACLQGAADSHRAGDLARAEALYWRARAASPDNYDAAHLLGVIAAQRGRDAAALAWFEEARRLAPENVEVARNHGRLLRRLGRHAEALAVYEAILRLAPDDAEARRHRPGMLRALGRADAALQAYAGESAARPDDAEAGHALGSALLAAGREAEALAIFERVLVLDPGHAEARNNLGNALRALGRHAEALAHYRRAIELRPDYAKAHWNLAVCEMLLGRFETGWAGMEWRQRLDDAATARVFPRPLWLGEASPAGAVVLLHAEQGLGDCLQFCRYVPLVADLGARVILEVPAGLRPLMLELPGVAEVVALGDPLPAFDLRCPLPSLPLACKTTLANLPAGIPYLRADPARLGAWAARLGPRRRARVGLVWRGNPAHANDRRRSLALALLARALPGDAGIDYYALQKDPSAEDAEVLAGRADIVDLGAALADFADTAAVCALMDLVLCVDTSVAHLAGALGRPTWIMLPFDPDWRWLLARDDSPWYPSARLYRQAAPDDWSEPLRRVAADLRAVQVEPARAALEAMLDLADETFREYLRATSARHAGGDLDGVEATYRQLAAARPGWFDPWHLLGVVAAQSGRAAWAVEAIGRALAIDPDNAAALGNRGNALHELGRHEAAMADYDRAARLAPDFADAHANRGRLLRGLGRHAEALASYQRAAELAPGEAQRHSDLGIALADTGRHDAALQAYAQALALDPGHAEARWNRALCLLQLGRLEEAWPDYEGRWRRPRLSRYARDFPCPQWRGEPPVAGKTILLHSEQGYGDSLQCCRYAPRLAALGARVIIEVELPLVGLLRGLAGASAIVAKGDPLPAFDMHCPFLSLPLAFKTGLDDIPAEVPYLAAAVDKRAAWAARLGSARGRRVGLAWSGNAAHDNDRRRSLRLAELLAALPMDRDIEYHSLQKDPRAVDLPALRAHPGVRDWSAELGDFGDTAALCAGMDLVISVDTSVAHLAGALGRPLWLLLPRNPDWRWLLEREDSPWYPTARLFRQDAAGTWDAVLGRVATALREGV